MNNSRLSFYKNSHREQSSIQETRISGVRSQGDSGISNKNLLNFSKEEEETKKDVEYSNINFSLLSSLRRRIELYDQNEVTNLHSLLQDSKNTARVQYSKFANLKKISFEKIFHSYILKYEGTFEKTELLPRIEKLISSITDVQIEEEMNICLIITKNILLVVKILEDDFKQERRNLENTDTVLDIEAFYTKATIEAAKIINLPFSLKKFLHCDYLIFYSDCDGIKILNFFKEGRKFRIVPQNFHLSDYRVNLFQSTKSGRIFFENKENMKLVEIDLGGLENTGTSRLTQFIRNPFFFDYETLGIKKSESRENRRLIEESKKFLSRLITKEMRIESRIFIDETNNILYHFKKIKLEKMLSKAKYETMINVYNLGAKNLSFQFVFNIDETEIYLKAKRFILENNLHFDLNSLLNSEIVSIKPINAFEFGFAHLVIFFSKGHSIFIELKRYRRKAESSCKGKSANYYFSEFGPSKGFKIVYMTGERIIDYKSILKLNNIGFDNPEFIRLGNFSQDNLKLKNGDLIDKTMFLTAIQKDKINMKIYRINLALGYDDKTKIKNKQDKEIKPTNEIFVTPIGDTENREIFKIRLKISESEFSPSGYLYDKNPLIFSRISGEEIDFSNFNSLAFYDTLETQTLYSPHILEMVTSHGLEFLLKLRPIDSLAASLYYQNYYPPFVKEFEERENQNDERRLFKEIKPSKESKGYWKDFMVQKNDVVLMIFNEEVNQFLKDYGPLESAVSLLQILSDQSGEYFIDQKLKISFEKKYRFPNIHFENSEISIPKEVKSELQEILMNPKHLEITKDEIKKPASVLWRELSNLYLFKTQQQKKKTDDLRMNFSKINTTLDEKERKDDSKDRFSYMQIPSYHEPTILNNMSMNDTNMFNFSNGDVCPSLYLEANVLYLNRILRPLKEQKLFVKEIPETFKDISNLDLKPSILVKDLEIIIKKVENLIEFLEKTESESHYKNSSGLDKFTGFGKENWSRNSLNSSNNFEKVEEDYLVYQKKCKDYVLQMLDYWTMNTYYKSVEMNQYSNYEVILRKDLFNYLKRSTQVLKTCCAILLNYEKLSTLSKSLIKELEMLNFSDLLNSTKTDRLINKCLILIIIHSDEDFFKIANTFRKSFPEFIDGNDCEFVSRYKDLLSALREKAQSDPEKEKNLTQAKTVNHYDNKIKNILERLVNNSGNLSISCLEIMRPLILQVSNPDNYAKMVISFSNRIYSKKLKILKRDEELKERCEKNTSKEQFKVVEIRRKNAATLFMINELLESSKNLLMEIVYSLYECLKDVKQDVKELSLSNIFSEVQNHIIDFVNWNKNTKRLRGLMVGKTSITPQIGDLKLFFKRRYDKELPRYFSSFVCCLFKSESDVLIVELIKFLSEKNIIRMSENSFKILLENFAIFDFSAPDIKSLLNLVSVKSLKKENIFSPKYTKKALITIIYFTNHENPSKTIPHTEKYLSNKDRLKAINYLKITLRKSTSEDLKEKEKDSELLKKLELTEMVIELQEITAETLYYQLYEELSKFHYGALKDADYNIENFNYENTSKKMAFMDILENKMDENLRHLFRAYKVLLTEVLSFESLMRDIVSEYKVEEADLLYKVKYQKLELGELGNQVREYVFKKAEEKINLAPFPRNLLLKLSILFEHLSRKSDSENIRIIFPWSDLIETIVLNIIHVDDDSGKFFSWRVQDLKEEFIHFRGISFLKLWISELILRFYPSLEVVDLIRIYSDLIKSLDQKQKTEVSLKCAWLYLNCMVDLIINWSFKMNSGPSKLYSNVDMMFLDKHTKYAKETDLLEKCKKELNNCVEYCYGMFIMNKNLLPRVNIGERIEDLRLDLKRNFERDEEEQSRYVEKYNANVTLMENLSRRNERLFN